MFLSFFDEVYVINLPFRTDRLAEMEEELSRHGIAYTVFEATHDDNGVKGLVETMKRLLGIIISKKQKNVIILEDDAQFLVKNPVAFLHEVLPQLPKNYHLFYLGLNLIAPPKRISENIMKVTDCYSTHAIAYSHEGARIAYERLNAVPVMPYDIFIRQEVLPLGQSYCTIPMMATQRLSYSDIEKNIPKWGDLMSMTFNMHTKNIQIMAEEIISCQYGHKINGEFPVVDSTKFEVQNPELIGKECDCNRFVYDEGLCPTCSGDKWKIIWREK